MKLGYSLMMVLAIGTVTPSVWADDKVEVWNAFTPVTTAVPSSGDDDKGIEPPSGHADKVAVLMNLSNNQLLDVAKQCAKAGAMRATLIGLMTSWDTAWPVFKQEWDRCIDGVVAQPQYTDDQSRSASVRQLKGLKQSDFEVRVRQLSQ
jgi:hypothetical protein